MSYRVIKYEKEEGFSIITLNRPEHLNAMPETGSWKPPEPPR
jgi:enoyl-CoA hydratase/carnithine racemase